MRIVIFGGNGFIGSRLAAALAGRGHALVLPVRDRERAKERLILLPQTDVLAYDPKKPSHIAKMLTGADAVVNLAGILNEGRNNLFVHAHEEFVRMLCEAAKAARVGHFVQASAIGAAHSAASHYLRSKAKGEQIVRAGESFRHAIVRLSVVYGEGDQFVCKLAAMLRFAPILPLPCAHAQIQPIAVADAVALLMQAVEDDSAVDETWHGGGPEAMPLWRVAQAIAAAMGLRRKILPMGAALSYMAATVAEFVPFTDLLTRDNCLSTKTPAVCPAGGNDAARRLGELTTLQTGLEALFAADAPALGKYRPAARR